MPPSKQKARPGHINMLIVILFFISLLGVIKGWRGPPLIAYGYKKVLLGTDTNNILQAVYLSHAGGIDLKTF